VSHVLARAHRTRCRIRSYQRSAQLSSSCSTTGRAPLLRRTDPANRTDAKVRLPAQRRHNNGSCTGTPRRWTSRIFGGSSRPIRTRQGLAFLHLGLLQKHRLSAASLLRSCRHRATSQQQALVRWERERRCVRCVFFFSCGSSRAMVEVTPSCPRRWSRRQYCRAGTSGL
jgi:hypothetical protein